MSFELKCIKYDRYILVYPQEECYETINNYIFSIIPGFFFLLTFLKSHIIKWSKIRQFRICVIMTSRVLFHHQIATSTENVKFREVNVDLLPGTSSGK